MEDDRGIIRGIHFFIPHYAIEVVKI